MTDQNATDLISVPKGGGAISGIGETFQPDLHTGTGNLTIPLGLPGWPQRPAALAVAVLQHR